MSESQPRVTGNVALVLEALMSAPGMSGADITRLTGLKAGTLYPILMRAEDAGWLDSQWEGGDPSKLGRPRKRFYFVTAVGERKLRTHLEQRSAFRGDLAWR